LSGGFVGATWGTFNNLVVSNGGFGIAYVGTPADAPTFTPEIDFNAYFSNTSGARSQFQAGAGDVTLTGNPFTNAAGGDFSLNSTSGAGAACRGTGYPGVFPGGLTTGHVDIGAVQHAASGGAAGVLFFPGMAGGMEG
jgi:hypothetical protein